MLKKFNQLMLNLFFVEKNRALVANYHQGTNLFINILFYLSVSFFLSGMSFTTVMITRIARNRQKASPSIAP